MNKPFAITFALAAALSLSTVANAGQTAPISALPTLPAPKAIKRIDKVPGLEVKTSEIGRNKDTKWQELIVKDGFCLGDPESGARWTSGTGASEKNPAQELDLNHLVEQDGKTVLERTKISFDPAAGTVAATARSHVELVEVARGQQGIVVYAYREGTSIVLVARHSDGGTESHTLSGESGMVAFVSSDCSFAGVRIDARKPELGAIAQMGINIPPPKGDKGPPAHFVVDASISKVSRDPEPKLSVRIRQSQVS